VPFFWIEKGGVSQWKPPKLKNIGLSHYNPIIIPLCCFMFVNSKSHPDFRLEVFRHGKPRLNIEENLDVTCCKGGWTIDHLDCCLLVG
jgi:hypothetical protein